MRTVWESGEAGELGELALAQQDVLLTVPASFDEEARELTRRAAEQAGYPHVTLLEEPLAAFYAWLENQGDAWRRRIKVGDLVLVCDVGGGTTDLSPVSYTHLDVYKRQIKFRHDVTIIGQRRTETALSKRSWTWEKRGCPEKDPRPRTRCV